MSNNIVDIDPPPVALECIDEILSYGNPDGPQGEPGEIDGYLLHCEFEDYPAGIDREVYKALKVYAENYCRDPLKHIDSTTPGYTKIVRFLKPFLLVDREYPPGWSDN